MRLSDDNVAARSPSFNPAGSSLVWLESKVGGPHIGGTKLVQMSWPSGSTQTIVDISSMDFVMISFLSLI